MLPHYARNGQHFVSLFRLLDRRLLAAKRPASACVKGAERANLRGAIDAKCDWRNGTPAIRGRVVVFPLRCCTGGMLERFAPDTGYPSRSRDFTIPAALCEKNNENEEYD